MALRTYNPVTPGQRQLVLVDRAGLHTGKPVKALTEGKNSTGGRNNNGHITSRYRGGGHKQAYRRIDFRRRKFDMPARVERLEYDPNRTSFIALVKYDDGELAYILAPQRLGVGDSIVAGEHVDVKPGNAMPIANIPAILTAAEHHHDEPGAHIYNLGTEETVVVDDSVKIITEHLALSPDIEHTGGRRGWTGDSPLILLDTARIRELGWQPTLTIEQAIARTLEWLDSSDYAWREQLVGGVPS